ncbi:DUF2550 domain-containing protein [Nocardia alba]|uniref:Uncharacterized protein DUF2550 n=1 Tax=Nocardia alba TaxID=225051 RepID=A0A4R1FJK0_9NOCA|nr:DUF2550 domain-containing protein [Nocardia alba]TCJ94653.1 uncharacterized protein DUF2550 [Nocardia alba]
MVLLIILVLTLVFVAGASTYRLVMLRRGGTAALLRALPARGGQGWRHGLIRYDEDRLVFFKLTSLKFGPDSTVHRQGLEIVERRSPQGDEFDIMSDDIVVVAVTDPHSNFELALDRGSMAAFLSWVESRPSDRARRTRGGGPA